MQTKKVSFLLQFAFFPKWLHFNVLAKRMQNMLCRDPPKKVICIQQYSVSLDLIISTIQIFSWSRYVLRKYNIGEVRDGVLKKKHWWCRLGSFYSATLLILSTGHLLHGCCRQWEHCGWALAPSKARLTLCTHSQSSPWFSLFGAGSGVEERWGGQLLEFHS